MQEAGLVFVPALSQLLRLPTHLACLVLQLSEPSIVQLYLYIYFICEYGINT